MYWMAILLILLGVIVAFIILQRYTQNKTLWITDMSATIWFSVSSERFELIKHLIDEYNQTLPKNTGVVVVGVNFENEDELIERLEDSLYTFSTVQVPDMIFLPEQSLKKLYQKKFVLSLEKDDSEFRMFPIMASIDMMYVNTKRFASMQKYIQKNPESFPKISDESLLNFEGLYEAADVYTRIQVDENLVRSDGIKPFITVNSLNKFFAVSYMQLGGDCKAASWNFDSFYKVWRFIVKGLLLGYITVIPEQKQFFNKMDTVKSPVVIGSYLKNQYKMSEYPRFEGSEKTIVPITKYGMSFVMKRMNDTKKSVLSYFGDWFVQQSKNSELAVYCDCLPIVNNEISADKELLKDTLSMFSLDIDMDEDEMGRITERTERVHSLFEAADEFVDYSVFTNGRIEKVVSKINDYVDACRHKLDAGIDYKNPDDDTVGTMYTRKAFDNWVNYFDL